MRDTPGTLGPRRVAGARAPLFDRLADERHPDPFDPAPPTMLLLDRDGLSRSIAAALAALLNTRAPVDAEVLAQRRRSTIDYGIPDLSLFAPNDDASLALLSDHLKMAIEAYEPRLAAPHVRVERDPARAGGLVAVIAGQLTLGETLERVDFRFGLGPDDG